MKNIIDFRFERPGESTGYLLWQTTMVWQRQINRVLSKIGLTHTQFVIMASLGWLLRKKEEVSQKDIAIQSNTDRMIVSKVLRTLQKNELIQRKESQKDTRSKLVFLTQEGVIRLQDALKLVEKTHSDFFSVIEKDIQFNKTLSKIITSNIEK